MSMGSGHATIPIGYLRETLPASPSTSKSDQPFEFTVPPIPPRLAKIGRRISQMSADFASPDGDRETPSRRGSQMVDVPGMGDDPVMCPFCNKPLPPALFASHQHPVKKSVATPRPSIAERRASGIPASTIPEASSPVVTQQKTLLDPLPVASPVVVATAESLASNLGAAEAADALAIKTTISPDEIQRWSRLAGLPVDPPAPTEPEKDIPLIPPPPENQRSTSSSSRFGFFRKGAKAQKEDDDDSDDEGGPSGYAKLTAPGSPSDDEKMHDEPKDMRAEPERPKVDKTIKDEVKEAAALTEVQPKEEDLKQVLKEILGKVTDMSTSQNALVTSHASLLTSLKIAKSNLAMAEANTEMLEAQLRLSRATPRVPSGAAPVTPNPPAKTATPAAPLPAMTPANPFTTATPSNPSTTTTVAAPATAPVKSTPDAARKSLEEARLALPASVPARRPGEERVRPMSLQLPPPSGSTSNGPASAAATENKGVFDFWKGGKKKLPGGLGHVNIPTPAEVMASLPGSPATERRGFDFFSFADDSPAQPTVHNKAAAAIAAEAGGLKRSASSSTLPTIATSPIARQNLPTRQSSQAPGPNYELYKIRQAYAAAQGRMEGMSKELAELKKGKIEMEAELENLSQALFEEANKMVADERRKRAEVEENLKEVREEREALKETIKVLGGNVEDEAEEEDTFNAASFEPRDLDKHYEALRKTIHHVADGAEGVTDLPGLSATTLSPETAKAITIPSDASRSALGTSYGSSLSISPEFSMARSASMPPVSEPTTYDTPPDAAPPVDPNPWSDPSPPEPAKIGLGIITTPPKVDGEVKSSPVEDLDRLMAKLHADMEES